MENLNREIFNVQNPAIGAGILWRFVCGHYSNNKPVEFPLLFIVLPIIFREDFGDIIAITRIKSGLSKFYEKLFDKNNPRNDSLGTINDMAIQLRRLTLDSINIALRANLLYLNDKALVIPIMLKISKKLSDHGDLKSLLKWAEKFGVWCSEYTLLEISKWLKVRF